MKTFFPSRAAVGFFSLVPAAMALTFSAFGTLAQAASIRFLPINEEMAGRKIALQDGKHLTELKDLNPKKRSKAYSCTEGKLVALDHERPNGTPASVEIKLTEGMKSPLAL